MLDLEGAWVFITHPGCRFEYELAGARPHHYRVICFNGAAVGRYIEHGLLPMAHKYGESHWSLYGLIAGMFLMALGLAVV